MPTARRWRCCRARPRPRSTLIEAAAAHGFTGFARLAADPLFAPLAGDAAAGGAPRRRARPPVPAPVRGGLAPVDAGNTGWNPASERLEPRFGFPAKPDARVLPRGEGSAAENILAELWRHGRAAGNHGDLYDNRDRGHSRLDPAAHPQLSFVDLCRGRPRRRPRLRAQRAPAVRSSDLRQLLDRDHRRRALAQPAALRDDPGPTAPGRSGSGRTPRKTSSTSIRRTSDYADEDGDLFPANTPYILVSRGSSGSDKPLPRRARADPRRLPARHQATARSPRT